jgi:hypothetical protein
MKIKDTFFRIFNFFLLIFLPLASFSCEGFVFYHNGRLKDDLEAKYASTVRFFAEKGDLESTAYVSYSYKMGTELSIYDLLKDSKIASLNPGYYLSTIDFYRIVLGDLDDDDSSNYSSSYPDNIVFDDDGHLVSYVVGKKNVDFVLNWSEKPVAFYTVNHYIENVDDDYFTLYKSEKKYGLVGEYTSSEPLDTSSELIGFVSPSPFETTVQSDNSTEIAYLYYRIVTCIHFYMNGGSYNGEGSIDVEGKYGAKFPEDKIDYSLLSYPGYKYSHVIDSNTGETVDLSDIVYGLEDYYFKVIWEEDDSIPASGSISINVEYPEDSASGEISLTVSLEGSKLTAVADITSGTAASSLYTWIFNNEVINGQTGSSFSLDLSSYSAGVYELMVIAELEEDEASAAAQITITR